MVTWNANIFKARAKPQITHPPFSFGLPNHYASCLTVPLQPHHNC